jgi:hypothetical protein
MTNTLVLLSTGAEVVGSVIPSAVPVEDVAPGTQEAAGRAPEPMKVVTEPLKLLPYYRLNPFFGPLSHNIEVTRRLCRVVPGKSLTSQD